jgi:hypothetical protein
LILLTFEFTGAGTRLYRGQSRLERRVSWLFLGDTMENTLLLHILRNPYGWDDNEVRKARLTAADLIEDLERQLEFEKSKKRSRGFVGFGLFNRGELVTCSKHELAISIGSQAIECLPLYVMREGEEVGADKTANA